MKSCPDHYYVTVVEDLNKGKIVASATLAIEYKFIRDCAKVSTHQHDTSRWLRIKIR